MYFRVIAKHYQRCTITFTATETSTYTVEIAWMTIDSNGNYINDDSKGYNKRKITVSKQVETTWYRLLISISGVSYKTTFDTDDWTLTATVTAQSITCVVEPATDATWTTITTPSRISYSLTGASSTSSTSTVGVYSVSIGYDRDHLGTKYVTVEVSLFSYTGDSATVTLGRYGKSYYNG